jgi:hypothetical protein
MMSFSHASRARLTDRDLDRFPADTLFDHLARAVCHAGCLPRKELYESWGVARRAVRACAGDDLRVFGNRFIVGDAPGVRTEPNREDLAEIAAVVKNASLCLTARS